MSAEYDREAHLEEQVRNLTRANETLSAANSTLVIENTTLRNRLDIQKEANETLSARYLGMCGQRDSAMLETARVYSDYIEARDRADGLQRDFEQAERSRKVNSDLYESTLRDFYSLRAQLQTVAGEARRAFADEVIALITTEQASMSGLYEKHSYGINKVCNRLKLFVGDLLKKPAPSPAQEGGDHA